MRRFIKENKGETLIETLVAILILTLSAMLLTGMSATANRINLRADAIDAAYRSEVEAVEKKELGKIGTITIAVDAEAYTYEVEYFGETPGLVSYQAAVGGI